MERREEFARLILRRGSTETGVEIGRADGEGEWSTHFYRVQPAPGQTPPKELLRAILNDLQAWEQQPGHIPFLALPLHQHGLLDPADRGTGHGIIRLLFATLLMATALFTVAVAWLQGRQPHDRTVLVAAAMLIALSTAVAFVFLPPAHIPADWVEILTNGLTRNTIDRVFGRDLHAGPGYVFLTDLLASGPSERLRAIVRMNLWLSAVNTILFAFLARTLAGGVWAALVLTLWFAGNWAFVNAACSEVPSQMLTLAVSIGAIAVRQMNRPVNRVSHSEKLSGTLRLLQRQSGLFLLFLLVIWGWTIRPEFAVVGGIVLLSVLPRRLTVSFVPLGRLRDECVQLMRRGFESPLARLAAVLAVCAAYRFLDVRLERPLRLLLNGIMPFDESVFTLPLAMTLFLPPVLVALMVIGFWRGIRDGGACAGLVIALLLLHKLYVACASGGASIFDLLRWWANVIPAAMLFTALGWRSVAQPGQRWRNLLLTVLLLPGAWQWRFWPLGLALTRVVIRFGFAGILCWPEISFLLHSIRTFRFPSSSRYRIAAWQWPFSVMLAGFLLWLPTQVRPVRYDSWQESFAHPPGYRLVNNQIREARFLIETFERHPDAILAAEVTRDNGAAHDWTFVGAGMEQPLDVHKDGRSLSEVVATSVPFAQRVLFYRGLDCNWIAESCLDPSWPVTDEKRFTSAPSSYMEFQRLPAGTEIVLSVRAIVQ